MKAVPEISLSQGVVLLDGGMGQELRRRGVQGTTTLWSAHALISAPDIVQTVHEDYIKAGARIVGGCCEVGPAHIARLHEHIRAA